MEKFLEFMTVADKFLPPIIEVVFLAITPLVVGLLVRVLSDKNRAIIADVAEGVFLSVENLAKKTAMTSDDKLAEGLKKLAEELGREPKEKEVEVAKKTFDRLAAKTKLFGVPVE